MDAYASHREQHAILGLREGKYRIAHLVSQHPGMWSGARRDGSSTVVVKRRGGVELDIVTL